MTRYTVIYCFFLSSLFPLKFKKHTFSASSRLENKKKAKSFRTLSFPQTCLNLSMPIDNDYVVEIAACHISCVDILSSCYQLNCKWHRKVHRGFTIDKKMQQQQLQIPKSKQLVKRPTLRLVLQLCLCTMYL